MSTRYRIVNTWNAGKGGREVVYTSTETSDKGHNQCFVWIHHNTPFSFDEATKHQGYVVEPVAIEEDQQ
jgi:hypothetical protein